MTPNLSLGLRLDLGKPNSAFVLSADLLLAFKFLCPGAPVSSLLPALSD